MSNPINPKRKRIQQVCVIPFRRLGQAEDALKFCLITSLLKKRWIFPKGIIDPGETAEQAALKEIWEEAGLRGQIVGEPLGEFEDQKWGCKLRVKVLMVEVTETAEVWPEAEQRQRQWLTASAALGQLKRRELKSFLRAAFHLLQRESLPGSVSAPAQERSAAADS